MGEHGAMRRRIAGAGIGAAYAAILAFASWGGGETSGDDEGASLAAGMLTLALWVALSVACGYLLPRLVFLLIPLAVAIPAFIGERGEHFDEELRYFNWFLIAAISAALVLPGVWLAHRRTRRA